MGPEIIVLVKGPEDAISPGCVKHLQIKQESDKVLVEEKGILHMVFQVHQLVKGESMASISTLGI
jgi:hypothetical protein